MPKPRYLVFDAFGVSGTTAIACQKTGRAAVAIELPKYCDVIVRRANETFRLNSVICGSAVS